MGSFVDEGRLCFCFFKKGTFCPAPSPKKSVSALPCFGSRFCHVDCQANYNQSYLPARQALNSGSRHEFAGIQFNSFNGSTVILAPFLGT